jgi:adenylate cyclase
MGEERLHRHLAAILVADVVGYSRLMGRDEAGTLTTLKALRTEIFDPKTTLYGGRIFKNTGDGALAEFPSAVDAVLAAIDVQRALAARNAHVPEERQIELRIGISVGDVIVDGDDLFGNGVNVAARMENLSGPGGICVSANVHEQVRATAQFNFEDIGEQEIKNIDQPVRAYRIGVGAEQFAPTPAPEIDAVLSRPAIAVLPFDNLTHDPEQEYLSDGLTEDIITALSLWRTFPVIARNSTFTYKGRAVKVQEIATELGARYVIEGSVRKSGDRVRVTVQLIDAETGHHVWAERYDRQIAEIFALQDEITERIATTVAPELERAERQRSGSKPPSDLQAWDYYLRGIALVYEFSKESNWLGREMFEKAVALDPRYSRGHAGIAYCHFRDAYLAFVDDTERSIAQCVETAQRAASLDETDSFARFILSRGLHLAGSIEQALLEARMGIELNPNDASCHASLGHLLIAVGQPDEGIAAMHRARRLSPKDPRTYVWLRIESLGFLVADRYDDATSVAKDALNRHKGDPAMRLQLAASLANAGHVDEARAVLAEGEPIDPAFLDQPGVHAWFDGAGYARLVDGLGKAGWAN